MVRRKANITSAISHLYRTALSKLEISCLPCNQVSIFCPTKVLAFLILVLSAQMVSGYIAITKYYHVNAGQRERKICIWLFMNKVLYVAPSNRSLTLKHCIPKQRQKARPLLNGNYHKQVSMIKDLVQKKYVHHQMWYIMKTGVV